MNIAIIGSRGFANYDLLKMTLDKLKDKITCIISGGANGADKLAERYAKENNIELKVFKANWDLHGKAAGYIRNKVIWDNSDVGIAFWDGVSKGTQHSFELAKKQNKKLLVIEYNSNKRYII